MASLSFAFRRRFRSVNWAFLLVGFICASCGKTPSYKYAVPKTTGDDWETASMITEGLDGGLITNLFNRINNRDYRNVHSVLIVRNGKLVVEEYFSGRDISGTYRVYDLNKLHEVCSVTKSVNSILVGIAIDQHLIAGVDENVSAFFPEYSNVFADSGKKAIQIKHLLTMSTGLSWDEWTYGYDDRRNDLGRMDQASDPVRYYLERPLVAKPGSQFDYSGGICLTLGEIVHHASGLPLKKFAERNLFGPLGISKYWWGTYSNAVVDAGGGLALRPRDMAKIGYLFLNGGRWNGKQIVSEKWIKDSTTNYVDARQFHPWIDANGYGYNWWLRPFRIGSRTIESYHAAGRGGQFIFIFPELNLEAVFTGWNDDSTALQAFDMLERYILPAVVPKTDSKFQAPSSR